MKGTRESFEANGIQVGDESRLRFEFRSAELNSGDRIVFPASGVTVIVGANNAGKSTLLRQLFAYARGGETLVQGEKPRLVSNGDVERVTDRADLIDWLLRNSRYQERESYPHRIFSMRGAQINLDDLRGNSIGWNENTSPASINNLFVRHIDATSRLSENFTSPGRASADDPPNSALHVMQDRPELFAKLNRISELVFQRSLLLDQYPGVSLTLRVGRVRLPMPARNEPLGEFGRAVASLPTLEQQGDGMRSFFALMLPVITETRRILLIDEPEAFLHPPQARALGREIGNAAQVTGMQIIVATHDKDFIAGLMASAVDLSVVRLQRRDDSASAHQLPSSDLRRAWDDRTLRYSNVLDGLFSQLVVICEGEQDCRFYEAALEEYVDRHGSDPTRPTLPPSDVLFIPSNGKSGFAPLIEILNRLSVPIVVIADLDLLRSSTETKALLEQMGGIWDDVSRNFRVATAPFTRKPRRRTVRNVLDAVTAVLDSELKKDPDALYGPALRESVEAHMSPEIDAWLPAKRTGIHATHGDARIALNALISQLDRLGICLVQVGELEGFDPTLAKNKEWLPRALSNGAHRESEADRLIERVLGAHLSDASRHVPGDDGDCNRVENRD